MASKITFYNTTTDEYVPESVMREDLKERNEIFDPVTWDEWLEMISVRNGGTTIIRYETN